MSHSSLDFISHRTWPLPATPWLWRQSWHQLAFIHYRVDADTLRSMIPRELAIQEFDGSAWVGIVPFRMIDVMRGNLPSLPPLRIFPELNVRTYVERDGRAGVWFFSLDADCWPIVLGGRVLYGLPYYKARMSHRNQGGRVAFESVRSRSTANFSAQYWPTGPVFEAKAGTFEFWATERYCLYSQVRSAVIRLDVHHRPWPLQQAQVEFGRSNLLENRSLCVQDPVPVCHFSTGVAVVSYRPTPVK